MDYKSNNFELFENQILVKRLISIPQASSYLGISKKMVEKLMYRGEIPYYKVGKLVRFRPEEIDFWLSKQRSQHVD